MSDDNEIIEIWIDSIADEGKSKKIDIEKDFNYLNPFFLITAIVLILVFIIQVQNWFFSLEGDIDMENFTYKYSNYREWWNIFWIFTSVFLHWGIGHIIWNLLFFYIFSLVIYRLFSLEKSIFLFIILWVVAWIPWYFLNDIPSIWASWAIFWLFWMTTVFYFLNKDSLENNLWDIAVVLLILACYEFFLWAIYPIIDNVAHVSWYLWGVIAWYLLLKNSDIIAETKKLKEEL